MEEASNVPCDESGHAWEMYKNGTRCQPCHKRIKACSTHEESQEAHERCVGRPETILKGLLDEMIATS